MLHSYSTFVCVVWAEQNKNESNNFGDNIANILWVVLSKFVVMVINSEEGVLACES